MAQEPKITTQQPYLTSQPTKVSVQVPTINQTETEMAWDDLRTSKAFPAIVGGLAGAGIGVAMMLIVNRLTRPKVSSPAAYDANGNPMNIVYLPTPNQFRIFGFTLADLVTLSTIGITMARQIQEFRRVEGLEQTLEKEGVDVPTAPPTPAEQNQTALKKK